jgi:hypothetical protein
MRQRTAVVAGCGLVLAWLVVSHSLAAYLAGAAPQAALRLNPREPNALAGLADLALNEPENDARKRARAGGQLLPRANNGGGAPLVADDGAVASATAKLDFSEFNSVAAKKAVDLVAVRRWAEASLMHEPLDARALRILGQAAAVAGNDAAAAKFMQAAAGLSLHESIAVYWLLVRSAETKDYKASLDYADTILRTLPGFDPYVLPILVRIADDKNAASVLKAALAADPPWRSNFLQSLPRGVSDEQIPLDLLLALRQTAKPPTQQDVNSYLDFLVQQRMYQLAYYTWLQFLPASDLRNAGLLYNGDFSGTPSGSPFDWHIVQGPGVTIDIEERPGTRGGHALVLDFEYGRVEYHSVRELVMLPLGHYRFASQYKGELSGPRGLKWRISCAEGGEPLAESAMIRGSGGVWSQSGFEFAVPEQNCRAQYLSLDLDARMPSEEFMTGSIWFDDVQISRLSAASSQ